MSEEEIKEFYENNMELPESGDMKAFYKMLDIIEKAYTNPIEAKFELMTMMMQGMMPGMGGGMMPMAGAPQMMQPGFGQF